MQKEHLHTAIESLLETILEQHQHIKEVTGQIPLIELDIIMSNMALAYEHLSQLKSQNSKITAQKAIVSEMKNMQEDFVSQETTTEKPVSEPTTPLVTLAKEKNPILSFVVRPSFASEVARHDATPVSVSEPMVSVGKLNDDLELKMESVQPMESPLLVINQEPVVNQNSQQAETIPSSEPIKQAAVQVKKTTLQAMGLFDMVATVADSYEEQPTLHDRISKNKIDSSLGKKLQKKPVDDMKKSIGINEKFSFINELFDGDLNSYNKTIDELNQSANLEAAMLYINGELTTRHNWTQTSKSFLNLVDLIERRFMK